MWHHHPLSALCCSSPSVPLAPYPRTASGLHSKLFHLYNPSCFPPAINSWRLFFTLIKKQEPWLTTTLSQSCLSTQVNMGKSVFLMLISPLASRNRSLKHTQGFPTQRGPQKLLASLTTGFLSESQRTRPSSDSLAHDTLTTGTTMALADCPSLQAQLQPPRQAAGNTGHTELTLRAGDQTRSHEFQRNLNSSVSTCLWPEGLSSSSL